MKLWVQNQSHEYEYWQDNWQYRFEIFDVKERQRIFIRPECTVVRRDLSDRDHRRNINTILVYEE